MDKQNSAKLFSVYKQSNIVVVWYYIHAYLSGCKFWCSKINRNIIDSQSACVHVLILHKIDLNSACFQKFGEGSILEMFKILLHIHLIMIHTCMAPKFGRQTPKITPTTAKTIFCAKFGQQNYNISCLCSNVWQKCNVKIACNVIVQSFDNCAYLYGLQAPEANAKICMHNVHASCVPKTNARRPKWKKIPRF